jgi:hypothetical protein
MRLIFYGVVGVLIVPAGEEVGGGLADHVPVDDVAAERAGGVEPVLDLFGRPVGDVKDAIQLYPDPVEEFVNFAVPGWLRHPAERSRRAAE